MNKAEVIVITGASAGVGRATARAFARLGARIALLVRGRDGLEGARKQVEESGRSRSGAFGGRCQGRRDGSRGSGGRLLRRQARDSGLHRIFALRAFT
jgi:NAD(P)-dependent dehydrogenase (short-subunit alcohol dehydrogenase family)